MMHSDTLFQVQRLEVLQNHSRLSTTRLLPRHVYLSIERCQKTWPSRELVSTKQPGMQLTAIPCYLVSPDMEKTTMRLMSIRCSLKPSMLVQFPPCPLLSSTNKLPERARLHCRRRR